MVEDIYEHYYGTKSNNRKQKTAHELAKNYIREKIKVPFLHSN